MISHWIVAGIVIWALWQVVKGVDKAMESGALKASAASDGMVVLFLAAVGAAAYFAPSLGL